MKIARGSAFEHQQPRRIARRRGAQCDTIRRKLEIEEIDVHSRLRRARRLIAVASVRAGQRHFLFAAGSTRVAGASAL